MVACDKILICFDNCFVMSKICYYLVFALFYILIKGDHTQEDYYHNHNITITDLIEQNTNEFVITISLLVSIVTLTIAQLWKDMNIFYYYVANSCMLISDVFNILVLLYFYTKYETSPIIMILLLHIVFVCYNFVFILTLCNVKGIKNFHSSKMRMRELQIPVNDNHVPLRVV